MTLALFSEPHWAVFAEQALLNAGIPCFVLNRYQVAVRPWHPYMELELRIPEEALHRAGAVLRGIFPRPFFGQLMPDSGRQKPRCPRCGGIKASPARGRLRALLEYLLFSIVLSTSANRLRCKRCGLVWLA